MLENLITFHLVIVMSTVPILKVRTNILVQSHHAPILAETHVWNCYLSYPLHNSILMRKSAKHVN